MDDDLFKRIVMVLLLIGFSCVLVMLASLAGFVLHETLKVWSS